MLPSSRVQRLVDRRLGVQAFRLELTGGAREIPAQRGCRRGVRRPRVEAHIASLSGASARGRNLRIAHSSRLARQGRCEMTAKILPLSRRQWILTSSGRGAHRGISGKKGIVLPTIERLEVRAGEKWGLKGSELRLPSCRRRYGVAVVEGDLQAEFRRWSCIRIQQASRRKLVSGEARVPDRIRCENR